MKKLRRKFFERKPEVVAKELLGKFLVRKYNGRISVARISETEAYLGYKDAASHSFRGKTKRNEVMFGPAGFAYIYFTYGMHWLLNFITEKENYPSGVLIRAVEPLIEWGIDITQMPLAEKRTKGLGPARLTRWLKINGKLNREDIIKSSELYIVETIKFKGFIGTAKKVPSRNIQAKPRIGVDYAGECKHRQLRFFEKGEKYASK